MLWGLYLFIKQYPKSDQLIKLKSLTRKICFLGVTPYSFAHLHIVKIRIESSPSPLHFDSSVPSSSIATKWSVHYSIIQFIALCLDLLGCFDVCPSISVDLKLDVRSGYVDDMFLIWDFVLNFRSSWCRWFVSSFRFRVFLTSIGAFRSLLDDFD